MNQTNLFNLQEPRIILLDILLIFLVVLVLEQEMVKQGVWSWLYLDEEVEIIAALAAFIFLLLKKLAFHRKKYLLGTKTADIC